MQSKFIDNNAFEDVMEVDEVDSSGIDSPGSLDNFIDDTAEGAESIAEGQQLDKEFDRAIKRIRHGKCRKRIESDTESGEESGEESDEQSAGNKLVRRAEVEITVGTLQYEAHAPAKEDLVDCPNDEYENLDTLQLEAHERGEQEELENALAGVIHRENADDAKLDTKTFGDMFANDVFNDVVFGKQGSDARAVPSTTPHKRKYEPSVKQDTALTCISETVNKSAKLLALNCKCDRQCATQTITFGTKNNNRKYENITGYEFVNGCCTSGETSLRVPFPVCNRNNSKLKTRQQRLIIEALIKAATCNDASQETAKLTLQHHENDSMYHVFGAIFASMWTWAHTKQK